MALKKERTNFQDRSGKVLFTYDLVRTFDGRIHKAAFDRFGDLVFLSGLSGETECTFVDASIKFDIVGDWIKNPFVLDEYNNQRPSDMIA